MKNAPPSSAEFSSKTQPSTSTLAVARFQNAPPLSIAVLLRSVQLMKMELSFDRILTAPPSSAEFDSRRHSMKMGVPAVEYTAPPPRLAVLPVKSHL